MMQVPILTYHANNITGMDYHSNDHIALAADLKLIQQMGLQVISLEQMMKWHSGQAPDTSVENSVVLTCDDGTDFDFHDLDHPDYGPQSSFLNILKNHQSNTGENVHITNFVIVSPQARLVLDDICLVGKGWWNDSWWSTAQNSGIMHIANHSWDHNHAAFDNPNITDDSFHHIDTKPLCEHQIRQAQDYLLKQVGKDYQASFFAYPYGNYSHYLRHEYLPKYGFELGLQAAFTTEPKHVTKLNQIWSMPRYVCNNDWKKPSQLQRILTQTMD